MPYFPFLRTKICFTSLWSNIEILVLYINIVSFHYNLLFGHLIEEIGLIRSPCLDFSGLSDLDSPCSWSFHTSQAATRSPAPSPRQSPSSSGAAKYDAGVASSRPEFAGAERGRPFGRWPAWASASTWRACPPQTWIQKANKILGTSFPEIFPSGSLGGCVLFLCVCLTTDGY